MKHFANYPRSNPRLSFVHDQAETFAVLGIRPKNAFRSLRLQRRAKKPHWRAARSKRHICSAGAFPSLKMKTAHALTKTGIGTIGNLA